mgnify:CR=1 FL=1
MSFLNNHIKNEFDEMSLGPGILHNEQDFINTLKKEERGKI